MGVAAAIEDPILHLTVIDGPDVHSLRVTDRTMRIGRDSTNELILRDRYISSHHAELSVVAGRVCLKDLRSTNGTRVRRNRWIFTVDHACANIAFLEDGDEVLLGQPSQEVMLRVSIVQPSSEDAGPPEAQTRIVETVACNSVPDIAERFGRDALTAVQAMAARMRPKDEPGVVVQAFASGLLAAFPRATHVTVYLLDETTGAYLPALALSRKGVETPQPISRSLRDQVLSCNEGVSFVGSQVDSLQDASIQSGLCAPLWTGDRVPGLVQVDRRRMQDGSFTKKELGLLVVVAHQAGLVLELSMMHSALRETMEKAVHGVVTVMEERDQYMAGHSQAVSDLARRIALRLGLEPTEVSAVSRAGALHDLGRFGVPAEILNKPGGLTEPEFRAVRLQPEVGANLLERFGMLHDLVPIILHLQESWDGTGYPRGLSGEAIPLGARIVAVADVFHTLVSHRAHRQAMSEEDALAEMGRLSGARFDPRIVGALEDLLSSARESWGADMATVIGWRIDESGNPSVVDADDSDVLAASPAPSIRRS